MAIQSSRFKKRLKLPIFTIEQTVTIYLMNRMKNEKMSTTQHSK